MRSPALLCSFCIVAQLASPSVLRGENSPGSGAPAASLDSLPPGLTLPVSLDHTLHPGRTRPGTSVSLRTMQRIPLGKHRYLPIKTEVHATVTASTAHPDSLTLTPNTLTYRGQTVPLPATILAAAGFVAVSATAIPTAGATDRANPNPANWTTSQLGGGEIMRSGWYGPLVNSVTQTVGSADPWGVYTLPASPGALPLALGPFSSTARGLFGYPPSCQLRAVPANTIACQSDSLVLRRGDTLLLQLPTVPSR